MNLIFFDMEGPLSIQDNAYELMKLFPDGGQVFEVISRYDDLRALDGRDDYDPGDTLVKFDKANESVLEGREQVIASLRYVHDFLLLTRTWDNISTRRKIKNFS